MTLSEKIIDLSRKGYTVRFQTNETFPDAIDITLFKTVIGHNVSKWFETIAMNCEYGLPHEEAIVYILNELEMRLKEA